MTSGIVDQVRLWQGGEEALAELTQTLSALEEERGDEVHAALSELCRPALEAASTGEAGSNTDRNSVDWNSADWKRALLSCRARMWATPRPVGLLVGAGLLILTDGQQGVILREEGRRCLPRSICTSLLLLAQTIVMADHALDARELESLRDQRTQATSTSLSEIDPIR